MKKGPVRREPDPSRVSLLAGFHADASARRPPRAFGPTRVPRRPVGSVFVVVVSVQGVAMRAVDVVDVIAVLNGLMPAPLTMGVLGESVLGGRLVFVVVVSVQGMAVRPVDIVDVIAVLNGLMPAPLTMGVLGKGVLGVQIVAHGNSFRSCS